MLNKIDTNLVEKLKKTFERRNKAFAKLSPSQKRVRIARDVLAQLRTKKLVAKAKVYVKTDFDISKEGMDQNLDLGLVLESIPSCEVCALGAIFSCAVKRADNLKVGGVYTFIESLAMTIQQDSAYAYVERFFSKKQRSAIEAWFENDAGYLDGFGFNTGVRIGSDDWDMLTSKRRMTEIMQNIVANNGTFKPGQLVKKFGRCESC